jgi:hypothetical protein
LAGILEKDFSQLRTSSRRSRSNRKQSSKVSAAFQDIFLTINRLLSPKIDNFPITKEVDAAFLGRIASVLVSENRQ